ncbi:Voltage dependent potassium channel [Trema orientale]|uniref:Voltage dependent potassium channel n=1 Tax=Trema orientale TaxID=63057 RepID=A0A2P5FV63_TREOI|nr:Voltage dependent potassium channel [Trema orientale]
MDYGRSKSVRFHDDLELPKFTPDKGGYMSKLTSKISGKFAPEFRSKKVGSRGIGKALPGKELSRVFSEDYEVVENLVLDPRGPVVSKWNKIFLVACFVSLFVDPLFFYLPRARNNICLEISLSLEVSLTVVRSLVDAFYIVQIFVRFRTAYVAPSSRVFGRGELIIDPSKITSKYIQKHFWFDLVAALPLPQVMIWAAIPYLRGSRLLNSRNVLRFIVIIQYLLRLYLIFPHTSQIVKATGVVTETAWAGAAYNLMLYMLASHVLGSCWYLLATERQEKCWTTVCTLEYPACQYWYFDCRRANYPGRDSWFKSSNITSHCVPGSKFFDFGIYEDALKFEVTASNFFNKYFYCLWWGLRNLSSLGQNLFTSTLVGEITFAIIIAILGLVLFSLLIGNMQTYLQSTTVRLEEWRLRRTDTEQWMHHRQLPHELKQNVRRYDQYRWIATRGVDEEAILRDLPVDLRRDIKRHLCLDLVRQVPLFDQMDEKTLDAICERLKPSLSTAGTCLVREGDPVNEMLFIIRGHLDSSTTNGGRTGFFNSCRIGPGEFCGEELLTWALDPRPGVVLPSSTRTVKAIGQVEAFALIAEDLKFVAAQFRRLHSKQIRHTFRFHSHQWRTWAACFVQAAWFRYKRRKEASELKKMESLNSPAPEEEEVEKRSGAQAESFPVPASSGLGLGFSYLGKLSGSVRGGSKRFGAEFEILGSLQKPVEPDFTVEEEEDRRR